MMTENAKGRKIVIVIVTVILGIAKKKKMGDDR